MTILDRILPWRTSDKTIQHEIHRMTHRGGWKNMYANVHIPAGEPRPTDDDNFWILEPGRYRYVRRVDGRYDDVVWTYTTAGADEYYEEQREQEKREQEREQQRSQLQTMSFEAVEAEYYGERNRLDKLDFGEIADRYETLRDQQNQ